MEIQRKQMKCNCGRTLPPLDGDQRSAALACPACGERYLHIRGKSFDPGRIVITPAANAVLSQDDVLRALARHLSMDWGELCEQDWQENELALNEGMRLFSSYLTADQRKFWIITEHDRSVTTILLPSDY
ncbi:hypothetical protein [Planctomicrobium sp. SH527]|uniref:hypothetical protein n=1 Tax=Planctomicrobium sp. SH527 TaxID=3448123 RepID=UPI003F5BD25C